MLITFNITSKDAISYLNQALIELPTYMELSTLNCSSNPDSSLLVRSIMALTWLVLQDTAVTCTFTIELDSLFAVGEVLTFLSSVQYTSLSPTTQTASPLYNGIVSPSGISTSATINSTIPYGNITELTAYQNVEGVYFVTSRQELEFKVGIYMFPQVLSTVKIHLDFTNVTKTFIRTSIQLETGASIILVTLDPIITTCSNRICTIDIGMIVNQGSLASLESGTITLLFDLNFPLVEDNELVFIDGYLEYSTADGTETITLEPLHMQKNPLELEVKSINNSAYLPDAGDVVSISCTIGHRDQSFTYTENITIYLDDVDPILLPNNDAAFINFTDSNSGIVNNFIAIYSSDLEGGISTDIPLNYVEVIELQFDVTISELVQPSMQLTLNITVEYNDTGQLL